MRLSVFWYVAMLAVLASGACFAQDASLAKIGLVTGNSAVKEAIVSPAAQEKTPTKPYLDMAMAQKVLDGAIAYPKKVNAPGGSIAIVDDGGHLILLHRMDGTMPATPPIATGKARTAFLFRMPTLKFEDVTRDGRVSMLKIEGFDPVAVRSHQTLMRGLPQFVSYYRGGLYRLASQVHKTKFESNPSTYAPPFGGYCAMSMGRVEKADVKTWSIVDRRLVVSETKKPLTWGT